MFAFRCLAVIALVLLTENVCKFQCEQKTGPQFVFQSRSKCSSFNSLSFDYNNNNVSYKELFKTFSIGFGNPKPLYSIPIGKFYLCYLHLVNAFAFSLLPPSLISKVERLHNMIWKFFFVLFALASVAWELDKIQLTSELNVFCPFLSCFFYFMDKLKLHGVGGTCNMLCIINKRKFSSSTIATTQKFSETNCNEIAFAGVCQASRIFDFIVKS